MANDVCVACDADSFKIPTANLIDLCSPCPANRHADSTRTVCLGESRYSIPVSLLYTATQYRCILFITGAVVFRERRFLSVNTALFHRFSVNTIDAFSIV